MEIALKELLGGYNKANIDISSYASGIDDAVERARKMDTKPQGRWPQNPGTHVYKVIEAINALRTSG